jgi:hypothetical protein
MPMRREKNSSTDWGVPTEKVPAFSRKKGRFSGKNSRNRVRFTCWSSTSTWAKSVLTVASSVSDGLKVNFASPPTSKSPVRSEAPFRNASPLSSR